MSLILLSKPFLIYRACDYYVFENMMTHLAGLCYKMTEKPNIQYIYIYIYIYIYTGPEINTRPRAKCGLILQLAGKTVNLPATLAGSQ